MNFKKFIPYSSRNVKSSHDKMNNDQIEINNYLNLSLLELKTERTKLEKDFSLVKAKTYRSQRIIQRNPTNYHQQIIESLEKQINGVKICIDDKKNEIKRFLSSDLLSSIREHEELNKIYFLENERLENIYFEKKNNLNEFENKLSQLKYQYSTKFINEEKKEICELEKNLKKQIKTNKSLEKRLNSDRFNKNSTHILLNEIKNLKDRILNEELSLNLLKQNNN